MSTPASDSIAAPPGTPIAGAIGAVLFDLDGTLYQQWPLRLAMACELSLGCARAGPRAGLRLSRILRTFRRLREGLRGPAAAGPLDRRQYAIVSEQLGCPPDEVEHIVQEWMHRRPLKWLASCRRAGLLECLDELTRRGVRTGIFSDYPAHAKLAALGLSGRFDLVLSAVDPEVNAFKPDPRGYLVAARRWGLPPAHVLYVGDRFDVDARGAAAAGMPCAILSRTSASVGGGGAVTVRNFKELRRVLDRST